MEHRATQLVVWKFWQHPHTVSFWVSTMGFFISFLATFAAAPLMPVIRDNLNLTKSDIVNSGIAAVTGTIGARVAMGAVCDLIGPRYGMACILLLTSPFVYGMAGVTNAAGFIACRCFIGLSLAAFVSNQFWATLMYNRAVVGAANATSGGWGNLGGGITQLLMPLFVLFFENVAGATKFQSWRWVYFIPGTAAVITGLTALTFGQGAPDGNYHTLKQKKQMMTDKVWKIYWVGCKNYRMWIAVLLYAFCFGVELTINNIIASYFYDRFELDLTVSGVIASCFGMMNLFARSVGGILSDTSARFFGMRGRLWVLFLTLALEGTFCAVLGAMDTLTSSIVVMIIFSFFVQASEGATYGIKWMGVTIVGVSFFTVFIHFPQWGSMFFPGNPTTSEEDYYGSEYNETEKKSGLADNSMKFAASSGAERGSVFEKSRSEKLEKIMSSQSARSAQC